MSLAKSDESFSAAPEQTVLAAALAAGLNLPHSCKSGNCGSCRARLLEGEVAYPHGRPLGVADSEAAEGFILLCQARARSDLRIETSAARLPGDAQVQRLPCRIERIERCAHDVHAVFLKLPAAAPFEFQPGQYLDIMLSGGRRRSFSIASPPHDSKLLELHVRRVVGGEFTETLGGEDARGRLLSIEGPLGHFLYREPAAPAAAAPMLLVGGGTGLAPLKSIIRHVLENGLGRDMTLYWGVRGEQDLYAHEWLRGLARRHASLRYVPVLSAPSESWRGSRGLVHEAVLGELKHLARYDVYASGPPAMIEALRRDFGARGVDASRLWFDSFDYAPDSPARQPTRAATRS